MDQFIFTHDPEGMSPWRPDYATLAFARLAARLGIVEAAHAVNSSLPIRAR
jgi:hypothetical protein